MNNNSDDDDDDEDTSSMLKNKMSQKGSGYRYCDFCEIQVHSMHCRPLVSCYLIDDARPNMSDFCGFIYDG